MRSSPRLLWLGLCALLGCSAQADELHTYELDDPALAHSSSNEHAQWESAPWSGSRWLAFPGGSTLKIAHPLGVRPTLAFVYLSFVEDDSKAQSTRSAFLGAGDVANLYDLGTEYVTVKNRSNADFYLRLVVQ